VDETLARELGRLGREIGGAAVPVVVTVHAGGEGSLEAGLGEVAEGIGRAGIEVRQGDGRGMMALPCLEVEARGRSIRYMALPVGPEAAPFVDAVLDLAHGRAEESREWARRMAGRETGIVVFIAEGCPHCPVSVASAMKVASSARGAVVSVVDAQRFGEIADRYGIRSVPAILLDRGLVLTGVVSADDLAEQILAQDRADYEARLLRSLVETGRFAEAGELLGGRLELFVEEWKQSTTSTRIGLMLVAEEMLGEDRSCLDVMVDDLVGFLQAPDAALRGDTADLLGRIGHPGARKALTEALQDPNPDVVEIAAEALEGIERALS
jgi:thiol-disulfide isomerase/thioredoxin